MAAANVLHTDSPDDFMSNIYPLRTPCVLHGVDIGPASSLWSPEYLADKCGSREVKVHVSLQDNMDFINKNFIYK